MNKRDLILNNLEIKQRQNYIPAAFFMHFDPDCYEGQAAIDKHLEYFRFTDMDILKIQYEQRPSISIPIDEPARWKDVPVYPDEFHEPTIKVVEGLVKAAKKDALVIMTCYSPFMWAKRASSEETVEKHLKENPVEIKIGLEIMTENVKRFVRLCMRAGIDGFYTSTQGGESSRFKGTDIFEKYIKPTDLAVCDEIISCNFNILHVCDYHGEYDDLTPYLNYPGHLVSCSLNVGDRKLTPSEIVSMFKRPFMGGLDRKGVIATGSSSEIRDAVTKLANSTKEWFVLGADCTVLPGTPWENIKTAIEVAHSL